MLAAALDRPVYPKDPTTPVCACFGLTQADIEQDVAEEVVTAHQGHAGKGQIARRPLRQLAANGQPCVAFVQKYFMQCRNRKG